MNDAGQLPTLSEVRVRVNDVARAAAFFGAVFGWEFRHTRSDTTIEAAVYSPPPRLVFTDDQSEPAVRLGFAVSALDEAAAHVERLGGRIELIDRGSAARGLDSQGTPLLLHEAKHDESASPLPQARGVLGVIFVFAQDLALTAEFYTAFAGWEFKEIGTDKDILFVKDGPPVGIRPASKSPTGAGGAVTFHISVSEPTATMQAIHARKGDVGAPRGAGMFATRMCHDDQKTPFALWYEPSD